jgi:hypothetical protein
VKQLLLLNTNLTLEAQMDQAAMKVWGITDRELKEIRRSLEELG